MVLLGFCFWPFWAHAFAQCFWSYIWNLNARPTGALIFDNQYGVICCPVLIAATSRICVLHNIEYRSLSGISCFKKLNYVSLEQSYIFVGSFYGSIIFVLWWSISECPISFLKNFFGNEFLSVPYNTYKYNTPTLLLFILI